MCSLWPGPGCVPDCPGLVSTGGPLSAPGPLLSHWSLHPPVPASHWSSLTLTVLAWGWSESLHPGLALARCDCTQVNRVGTRVTCIAQWESGNIGNGRNCQFHIFHKYKFFFFFDDFIDVTNLFSFLVYRVKGFYLSSRNNVMCVIM